LKKNYSWKFNFYFLDQKLQFTYPWASIKDAQATGKAFRPPKRTSSTSKHENSVLFLFLWVIFALLDPDPGTQINADPQPCLYLGRCHVAGHKAAGET
jgi:hypothetical protein